MYYFINDYSEGAHPKLLEALVKSNEEHLTGYGSDPYCASAKEKIKAFTKVDSDDIYFISGGTQTNMIVISTMLAPYEAVVAATTGHVNFHEAGAIEHAGRKVLTIPSHDGKIDAGELKDYLATFYADENHEHMAFPGMVYVSHPTEYGTLYSKAELTAISDACHEYDLPLFLDGARLGYALAAKHDLEIEEIGALTDVFYLGGTKVGALCGEAVVFTHNNAPKHFLTQIKQNGALLAKGRLMGVQFDALFTDDLYLKISQNAIACAMALKKGLIERGYHLYIDSPTNQQFIVVANEELKKMQEYVAYGFWEKYDDTHTVIRLATSWATKMDDVKGLLAMMERH